MKHVLNIFILTLFFTVVVAPASAIDDGDLTTLRSIGDPKGEFRSNGGAVLLRRVDIQVRNVGDVVAEDVKVAVEIPGGKRAMLKGPAKLGPNKTAIYSDDVKEGISGTQKLKAVLSCKNCR
jgi:hypothetical protein